MESKKKVLLYFFTLNSILSTYLQADSLENSKYDRLYNSMTSNLKKGISTKSNYRLIEKILKQRNKELRDLYLQGDYIVKPEYLEWQILFSGYYKETKKDDNTSENAKYHSDPLYGQEGYYDENGDFIITKSGENGILGKGLKPDQDIREVELGIRIPMKGTSRDPLNLNIQQPVMDEIITVSGVNVTEPTVTIPNVSVPTFTTVTVSVEPVSIVGVTTYSFVFPGSANGDSQYIASSGSVAPLQQQNFNYGKTTSSSTKGNTTTGSVVGQWQAYDGRRGSMEIVDNSLDDVGLTSKRNFHFSVRDTYMEGISSTKKLTFNDYQNFDFINQSSSHAVMKLVGDQDVYINNTDIDYFGRGLKNTTTNFLMLFHTDAHNGINSQDSRWFIGADTNINLGGKEIIFYGVQSHDMTKTGSGMINNGKITTTNNGLYMTKYVDGTGSRTGTASGNVLYTVATPGKRIIFTTIDADSGSGTRYSRNFYFINNATGEIRLNGTGDLLANFATPGNTIKYGTFIQNDGLISINGENSTGVVTAKSLLGLNNYGGSKIVFNKAVDLRGDGTIGAVLQHQTFNLSFSNINLNIGNGENVATSSGNSSGNDEELVENAVGIFFDNGVNMTLVAGDGTGSYTTAGVQNVLLGDNAKNSTLFRIDNGNLLLQGTIKLDQNTVTTNSGNTNGNNVGLVVTQTGIATLDTTGTILVSNGSNNSAAYTQDNGTVINNGTMKITGTNTNGIVTGYQTTAGNITNNGVIEKGNNGAAVVLAGGNFINGTNGIILTKDGSAGIYSNTITTPIINGGILINSLSGIPHSAYQSIYGNKKTGIIADNGGIAYYSDAGGDITIDNSNTTIMNGGLVFFNQYKSGASSGMYGQFTLVPGAGVTVEDGGTVFNFEGTPIAGGMFKYTTADFTSYINDSFVNIGNLAITMPTTVGEYGNLFVLNKTEFDLTTADSAMASLAGLGLNINSDGNYRFGLVANGKLNADNNAIIGTITNPYNLDNPSDPTNKITVVSSQIEIKQGTYIKGTKTNQILAKLVNPNNTSVGQARIAIVNNGNINMSGKNSISLYSRYGDITNNGEMNISEEAIGVYGINNTLIRNSVSGIINVGNKSIGIAGKTNDGLSIAGNDLVDIKNIGLIQSSGATEAIGIYASNENSVKILSDVLVSNNGIISMKNSAKSIGIFASNGIIGNTGKIEVGADGIAIIAKESEINNLGTINLSGDKAIGIHLENGSTITNAAGTINIDGKNVVIFNIKGSSAPFTDSFKINKTSGSTYVLVNVDEGAYTTKSKTLKPTEDSVLLAGTQSAIMIGAGTIVEGTDNSVALAADQKAAPGLFTPPYTVEAENQGQVTLGKKAVGIYVKNGASGLNSGIITIEDSSLGIYGEAGIGTIRNTGTVIIGANSKGMYGKDLLLVENAGTLSGFLSNGIGMFAGGAVPAVNAGLIDLSGDNSVGIFSALSASSTATITNALTGKIKIGDSTDPKNPAIGIYNENSDEIVVNAGEIEVGKGSLGIYKYGFRTPAGTVQHSGKITVGDGGVGIYSNGDIVNLMAGSTMILQGVGTETVGVYGANGAQIENNGSNLNIGNGNYGVILETGADFINNAPVTMGNNEVLVYSTGRGTITNNASITMSGDENIVVYGVNGETIVNHGIIDANGRIGTIGIYAKNGSIYSDTGKIFVGNSSIPSPNNPLDPNNKYAVGIYGEESKIENYSDIEVGLGGIGIYAKDTGIQVASNYGHIVLSGAGAIGMYGENATIINEITGEITINADSGIGMAGIASSLINKGLINLNSSNGMGLYATTGGTIENLGTINIGDAGTNNIGVGQGNGSDIISTGGIDGAGNIIGNVSDTNGNKRSASLGNDYEIPSIINSGVINVKEGFTNIGTVISIKIDPSTVRPPAEGSGDEGAKFVSDSVKVNAPYFDVDEDNPVLITGDFTQGKNATVYKLKDVFNPLTEGGGPNSGIVPVLSKSLTWKATPQVNSSGSVDIWMEKIPYDEFTNGLWYEDFGYALDEKYGSDGVSEDEIKIFNKIDLIEIGQEIEFRGIMGSLAGNVYANINQREEDISSILENSLSILKNSKNNTKENIKMNIIAAKGKHKDKTDGVLNYDYKSTGILALREVERTYKHKFSYSLGYMHTGFEFDDGNESEEWVDTIQLGFHNSYTSNDWKITNDLTGRASFHNIDRNIDWPYPTGRSEMNGNFETYSITSDNVLGKEISLGKNISIMPYAGLRAMYMTHPSFSEKGLESLNVDNNSAWSVKPKAGLELKSEIPLGNKSIWKFKGALDLGYEYELANLNEREYAKLTKIEERYHQLSKPDDEDGVFRTKASLGFEIEERYGIFITGDYTIGNDNEDEYRTGLDVKISF